MNTLEELRADSMSTHIRPVLQVSPQELERRLEAFHSAPSLLEGSAGENSFAIYKLKGYDYALATFKGLDTSAATSVFRCQTRGQASAIVDTLCPGAVELKPFFALAAFSRASAWFELERVNSREVAA